MRLTFAAVLVFCIGLAPGRVVLAHEVPTHLSLTEAAVRYLAQRDPRFGGRIDALSSILKLGAEREDDFIGALDKVGARGLGRFFFHFLPVLNDFPASADCDALQWGFVKTPCTAAILSVDRVTAENDYTYSDAVAHKNSQQGYYDLGYIIHLLEDMGSPAHTRNDEHGTKKDLFELLNVGRPVQTPSEGVIVASLPEELFQSLQSYTRTRFFSRDTIFNPSPPNATSEDGDYFFDGTRRIAYKGAWYWVFGQDPQDAEINEVIAREQFDELSPIIVRHVASLIKFFVDHENPPLPSVPDFFDFAVDWLTVGGNIFFGDNFDDGSLTTFPTSVFFSFSPVKEDTGLLRLRSSDGANRFTPGFLVDNFILGHTGQSFRLRNGFGNSDIRAAFRADVPLQGQAYGLQLFTFGTNEVVNLQVGNCGTGSCITGLYTGPPQVTRTVPVNLTGIQRIVLRLVLNDATNQVVPSFSTDGGTTFTEIVLPSPGRVFSGSSEATVSVFGSVTVP